MESSLAQQVKPRQCVNVSDFIYSNNQAMFSLPVAVLALRCVWE